ncbi:MAG: tetratricopeptide repeat protein [Desulfovibrio sp.]
MGGFLSRFSPLALIGALLMGGTALAGPTEDYRDGVTAARAGHMDEAIVAFSHIIDAGGSGQSVDTQNLASVYNLRGMCHEAKNETDQALADYSKAIEIDPKMAEAYGNRAMLYARLGDKDKAKADATAAKRIDYKVKVPKFD